MDGGEAAGDNRAASETERPHPIPPSGSAAVRLSHTLPYRSPEASHHFFFLFFRLIRRKKKKLHMRRRRLRFTVEQERTRP